MTPHVTNLFTRLPDDLPEEVFETLVDSPHVRIERIVSLGHRSSENFWYDQPQSEWVLLLKGSAVLEFEGEPPFDMQAGDAVLIHARRRHRVVQTAADEHTVWLAVHLEERDEG